MARTRRLVAPNLVHHAVARGVNGTAIFRHGFDKEQYLRRAARLAVEEQVHIHGYCLLPNHVHLLLTPTTPNGLARFFSRLHTWWATLFNKKQNRTGHLFQCRYYSSPLSECHYWTALRYVELNPVRAGLVRAPEHWPWSSARHHLRLPHPRLVPLTAPVTRATNTPQDWRHLLHTQDPEADQRLRQAYRSSHPCGPPGFTLHLKSQIQIIEKRQPIAASGLSL